MGLETTNLVGHMGTVRLTLTHIAVSLCRMLPDERLCVLAPSCGTNEGW